MTSSGNTQGQNYFSIKGCSNIYLNNFQYSFIFCFCTSLIDFFSPHLVCSLVLAFSVYEYYSMSNFLLFLVLHGFEDSSPHLRVRVSTLDAASKTKKRLLGVLKPIFFLNQFKST